MNDKLQEAQQAFETYKALRERTGIPSIHEVYWGARYEALREAGGEERALLCTDALAGTEGWGMYLSRERKHADIKKTAADCKACGLCEKRQNVVFNGGTLYTPLMVVGEGPGETEDAQGAPFVGKSGRLFFDELLPEATGYTRQSVYVTNVVKCRPPENRVPTREEISTCAGYLYRQIELVLPRVIVCLGATAGAWFASQPGSEAVSRVGDMRGKVWWWNHLPVVVTYHPAYVLRQPNARAEVLADLEIVASILAGSLNDLNRWRTIGPRYYVPTGN